MSLDGSECETNTQNLMNENLENKNDNINESVMKEMDIPVQCENKGESCAIIENTKQIESSMDCNENSEIKPQELSDCMVQNSSNIDVDNGFKLNYSSVSRKKQRSVAKNNIRIDHCE